MSICWEIQCCDYGGERVAAIEAGRWGNEIIANIVDMISKALNDDESVSVLKEVICA